MSLLAKLAKSTTIKESAVLSESKFFNEGDVISTEVPIINLAFSGSIHGGFRSGLIQFAGPSKHFKTNTALFCVKAYLDKYKDAVCLFYDSEFGTTDAYLSSMGIDTNRLLHTPITDVEQLKFDIVKQLDNLERGDKVIILIDSIGNLASKKETDDALDGKSVADMSRAKSIKSLFRIVTPQLTVKNIPLIAINHTYQEMGLFPRQIVSGGTGATYSSNTIFIMGRSQEKQGADVIGYNFNINIEKSRDVIEKSKFPLTVFFEDGINKYSGLLDLAVDLGFVDKPKVGWYTRVIPDQKTGELMVDKNWRAKETSCEEFWGPILSHPAFDEACQKKFKLGAAQMSSEEDVESILDGDILDEQ